MASQSYIDVYHFLLFPITGTREAVGHATGVITCTLSSVIFCAGARTFRIRVAE